MESLNFRQKFYKNYTVPELENTVMLYLLTPQYWYPQRPPHWDSTGAPSPLYK